MNLRLLLAQTLACVGLIAAPLAHGEEIGDVSTNWKLFGSDKIVVEAFDDPKVGGVTCHLSRARTGGIKGAVGVAEDVTEASIACRQVAPISFNGPIRDKEEVFSEKMSLVFKELHVVRFVDRKRNTLVYLTYSDRVISGSPKNSITSVPVPASQPIPVK